MIIIGYNYKGKVKSKSKFSIKNRITLYFILILSIIIFFSLAKYKYTQYRCKNINYAIKKYSTSGVFNKYKLNKLESFQINYSDSNVAIVHLVGSIDKAPYKTINCTLVLKKNKKGMWKVAEYYPHSYFLLLFTQSLHMPLFILIQLSIKVTPVLSFIYSST